MSVQRPKDVVKKLGGVLKVEKETFSCWAMPAAPNSDYQLMIYIHSDGFPQILAKRNGSNENEYFWYLEFENNEYETTEETYDDFQETIGQLLDNPSRIKHSEGILFGKLECEVHLGGKWVSLGSHGYFRWGNFQTPPISREVKEYLHGMV